jgi:CDP-Glycerol:Poly(glycerophosphate) glycerophosphotransferase
MKLLISNLKKIVKNKREVFLSLKIIINLLKNPYLLTRLYSIYFINKYKNKKTIFFDFAYPMHYGFCDHLLEELDKSNKNKIYILLPGKRKNYINQEKILNLIEKNYICIYMTRLKTTGLIADLVLTPNNTSSEIIKGKKIHIPHSMVSMGAVYSNSSFLNFDIIFCQGPEHFKEFSQFILKNNLNTQLCKTGYGKIDSLHSRFKKLKQNNVSKDKKMKTILLAPSWGAGNDKYPFEEVGFDIVKELLKQYKVIYRPHPCSITSRENIYLKLLNEYQNDDLFIFDYSLDGFECMVESDLLITDWSGIGFEYYFGLNKPVIYLDGSQKINMSNDNDFTKEDLVEYKYREKIGKIVYKNDILNICSHVINEIEEFSLNNVNLLLNELLYNFEESGLYQAEIINDSIYD